MKTLLIDDDIIFIMICKKLISRINFCDQVEVCVNGQLAINFLKDHDRDRSTLPDVILLDINMPVMNGWDFLDAYLLWSTTNNLEIPIFIISSTVHNFDMMKADLYPIVKKIYTKPLTVENLIEIKGILS